jgi:ubiquinone biosynthesis protein Coq4
MHLILGYSVSIKNELLVKVFEFEQTGILATGLAGVFGPVLLGSNGIKVVTRDYAETIQQARRARFALNVYFEKHFD